MSNLTPINFNLGYACICNCLRKKNIFSSRTIRLNTLQTKGVEYAKSLAVQNLNDLLDILKWNKENNIFFFRMSSEMFPFATYPGYSYLLDFVDDKLKEIGNYAKENNMRLTMHPSQFNVLSSPDEKVIINSITDLNHHCDILDRMGLDQNSVIIIHGGGVYNNKKQALERLQSNIMRLPKNTRQRLVLENCEMVYTVEDLLPISELLQVPIVMDYHHDSINPSTQSIQHYYDRVFHIWNSRNIKPKVHVSNSIPGINDSDSKTLRRKHSDYIQFLHAPLLQITFPIDVMLECKTKEEALLLLRDGLVCLD
jgi:UV DNA damage endonuclease